MYNNMNAYSKPVSFVFNTLINSQITCGDSLLNLSRH